MKKNILTLAVSASAIFFAGCETTTTIFDPATTRTGIRQEGTISSEEMREVTLAAVESAMSNPRFTQFLQQYQREKNDPNARPVVKLDLTINDTDDPDLNVGEITDMLNEALLNAGKVDVTLAEGADRTGAIKPGLAADIVVLAGDRKSVKQTWIDGKLSYEAIFLTQPELLHHR